MEKLPNDSIFVRDMVEMMKAYINQLHNRDVNLKGFEAQYNTLMSVVANEYANDGCSDAEYNECFEMFIQMDMILETYKFDDKGYLK